MRWALVTFVVLLAGRAEAGHCDVAIVRAPDDVRAVVERWLSSETCAVALEVRIMPVETGLYLIALDSRNRVRERVVPDAQSAGVLIASWAADDGLPSETLSVELEYKPATPQATIPFAPPSSAPAIEVDAPPARPAGTPRVHSGKTFGLALTGLIPEPEWRSGLGLRGELDLWARGHWRIGSALELSHAQREFWHEDMRLTDSGDIKTLDVQALVQAGYVASAGGWQLRAMLGAGLVATSLHGTLYNDLEPNHAAYEYPNAFGVFPTADASLAVGYAIGDHWLVQAGLMATWFGETFAIQHPTMDGGTTIPARGWDPSWFGGLRRAL